MSANENTEVGLSVFLRGGVYGYVPLRKLGKGEAGAAPTADQH